MKTSPIRPGKPGFMSYSIVLATGVTLTLLTVYAYRQMIHSHAVQANVQLRADYSEKEEVILRSIVALTPNRAIQVMQGGGANAAQTQALSWERIFSDALVTANASSSIPAELVTTMGLESHSTANLGDSALTEIDRIFRTVDGQEGFVSPGINTSLGAGYPPPLSTANATTILRDPTHPVISTDKRYGALAQSAVGVSVSDYPNFNLLTYPQINFGYARPGDPFVAKRNWWAFSMNLGDHDAQLTRINRPRRNFVLSIYEIPSQLAITADTFTRLGQYDSGEAWENVTIDGGVYTREARVEQGTTLDSISTRRGATLSADSVIGGQSFNQNAFTPGVREAFQVTNGEFFPVSLASESGRVAFVPINSGAGFFDRFEHTAETNNLSPTRWSDYSVGALQCAMQLDIVEVESADDPMPTMLRFSYLQNGSRVSMNFPVDGSAEVGLPAGYLFAAHEDQSYNFGTAVVDLLYGKNGVYAPETGVSGLVTFNNDRFGDPLVGTYKSGYYRPGIPFEIKRLPSEKICVAVYPQRFRNFLAAINADGTDVNNSIAVNVDYTAATGSANLSKPVIPCVDIDPVNGKHQYGLILEECADLTTFTRGFSLVTNLRTHFGDDFNVVSMDPPTGYTPTGLFYPPVSLFMPERLYGVGADPFAVNVEGQIGSIANVNESLQPLDAEPVSLLESRTVGGTSLGANQITVNLKPIVHPAELPPITMMNWLVVLEEMRAEFLDN